MADLQADMTRIMLPDLQVDPTRMIADFLFDPLSPKALLVYAACSKPVRYALQASDNLFIGLEKVKLLCTNASGLVKRSGSIPML